MGSFPLSPQGRGTVFSGSRSGSHARPNGGVGAASTKNYLTTIERAEVIMYFVSQPRLTLSL
jgi:hypothetical protein